MRTFVAIDIGETVAANIGGLQNELRGLFGQGRRGVKWVDPGLIHLTLPVIQKSISSSIPE